MSTDRDPSPAEVVALWRNQAKLLTGGRGRKLSLAELALPRHLQRKVEDRAEHAPAVLARTHPEYELVRELGPNVAASYREFLLDYYRQDRQENVARDGDPERWQAVPWRRQLRSFVISRRIRAFKEGRRADA